MRGIRFKCQEAPVLKMMGCKQDCHVEEIHIVETLSWMIRIKANTWFDILPHLHFFFIIFPSPLLRLLGRISSWESTWYSSQQPQYHKEDYIAPLSRLIHVIFFPPAIIPWYSLPNLIFFPNRLDKLHPIFAVAPPPRIFFSF